MEVQWKRNEFASNYFIPAFLVFCIWGAVFYMTRFQEDWDDRQRLLEIDRKNEEQAAMEKKTRCSFVLKMP